MELVERAWAGIDAGKSQVEFKAFHFGAGESHLVASLRNPGDPRRP